MRSSHGDKVSTPSWLVVTLHGGVRRGFRFFPTQTREEVKMIDCYNTKAVKLECAAHLKTVDALYFM